ncbi:MAG TPA: glycosyltransferase family 4 protein [Flavobacterium sp.]|nr:glycosyltransferase family 4 protein [Flavobacterium sp.]
MPKVILLAQLPLPYSKIGSWTTLYKNYFESRQPVDYIICKEPEARFQYVKYEIVAENLSHRLQKKFGKNNYGAYLSALEKVLSGGEKYIIQIIDNFGIIPHLERFLLANGLRRRCYIQFFYHGYPPFYENFYSRGFFEFIDEMVLLTHDSYTAHKEYYTVLPCRFSVVNNGIDTSRFHRVAAEKKRELKEKLGLEAEKTFIWCSQDRPKKGLGLILDAWKRIYEKNNNIALIVIGAPRNEHIKGVSFLGRIPNENLPQYYQAADAYLFPTLCHEGFGLSLIEALHCGCYCIASALGGVPEVLHYGALGRLVEKPHFVSEWVEAVEEFISSEKEYPALPKKLYSKETWIGEMNQRILDAKKSLEE